MVGWNPRMNKVRDALPSAGDLEVYGSCCTNDSASVPWAQTVLVLLVLVYSGNPAPANMFPIEPQLVALSLLFGFLLLRKSVYLVRRSLVMIAGVFAAILAIQCISFRFCPVYTIGGFFTRLFIGYAVIALVDDFPRVFVRAMTGLAILSFVFYIPYVMLSLVGGSVEAGVTHISTLLGAMNVRRPLLLHTFDDGLSYRNFGMFWEPGAFQGYLIIALVLLTFARERLSARQYRRCFTVLVIAVLTTMSTTGYIALALVMLLQYTWHAEERRSRDIRILFGVYVVLPLLIMGSVLAYTRLPFLGEKIESQLHRLDLRQGRWHRGRIGSLVFDWEYVSRRPFTGWGLHSRTRYALHPWMEDSEGMGNGFADFLAKFGLVGFATWLVPVLAAFHRLAAGSKWQTLVGAVILLLLLQGECFLAYPLFLGLAFLNGFANASPLTRQLVPAHDPASALVYSDVQICGLCGDCDDGFCPDDC